MPPLACGGDCVPGEKKGLTGLGNSTGFSPFRCLGGASVWLLSPVLALDDSGEFSLS